MNHYITNPGLIAVIGRFQSGKLDLVNYLSSISRNIICITEDRITNHEAIILNMCKKIVLYQIYDLKQADTYKNDIAVYIFTDHNSKLTSDIRYVAFDFSDLTVRTYNDNFQLLNLTKSTIQEMHLHMSEVNRPSTPKIQPIEYKKLLDLESSQTKIPSSDELLESQNNEISPISITRSISAPPISFKVLKRDERPILN